MRDITRAVCYNESKGEKDKATQKNCEVTHARYTTTRRDTRCSTDQRSSVLDSAQHLHTQTGRHR